MTTDAHMSTYRTKDMNLAAFLWCQDGAQLERVVPPKEGDTRNTVFFVLSLPIEKTDLDMIVSDYFNRQTIVEPMMFVERQKTIRDMLYNAKHHRRK